MIASLMIAFRRCSVAFDLPSNTTVSTLKAKSRKKK